jgi:HEXXH motif-containing protein
MSPGNVVLAAAQFESLAAGYGTPDALAVLRDGQLTKRKLLLGELMRRLGDGPAVDLLIRAERYAPGPTTEVLRHPHLDAWAWQALQGRQGTGYLAQLAAAAAVRAAVPFRIEVPVTHGWAYLPGVGALRRSAATTVVTSADIGGAGWEPLRTVELEPGYRVAVEDLEPYRDCYQWQPAPRLDRSTAARFATLLRGAWRILTGRHPEHAAAMRVLLRSVVPLVRPASGLNVSAASGHASGSVAVVIPASAEELALLLLHEFMHMKLDALRDLVHLHQRGARARFLAPWRMDPRPVGALLHGIYAHAGVTDYWRERRHAPDAPTIAHLEFAYWRRQNAVAVESLANSGELTPEGTRLVARLRETLRGWEAEEVPPGIAAKVSDMVLAQTVRWRLRNWRPSDGELDRVTAAWQTGAEPVAARPGGVLRTDTAGEPAGLPGIVGMIRSSVTMDEVSDPAANDLINGRRDRACSAYTRRVTARPRDDDAWIGWALAAADDPDLAAGLRTRPDLVWHALTADPRIDPVAFARWLGKALRQD